MTVGGTGKADPPPGRTTAAATLAGALAVLAAVALLWANRPYQHVLAQFRTSLADRTAAQATNIATAAEALDGAAIAPGEVWSFNRRVGPRSADRGYVPAPAYLEAETGQSTGGGVCQLSSTTYDAALLAGLRIVERHPHVRRVASVPPGRDATVWYGVHPADLKLANPYGVPVKLEARVEDGGLVVRVRATARPSHVEVTTVPTPDGTWRTTRVVDGRTERISEDRYRP